jgi:hypothetical protein
MRVRQLRLVNFRGFKDTLIVPRGHVLLVGEPRAGRSDVIEALRRIFNPDSTRFPLTEPLDFHASNVDQRAGAIVVVGDLGQNLEQRFFDQLEVWDSETRALVPELGAHDKLEPKHELVFRLCYRAEWNPDEKVADHWVDFPKFSNPETKTWEIVRRAQREALPFAAVQPASRPLDLAARSTFRRVVDAAEGEDFAGSIDALTLGLTELAADLARGLQVGNALELVMTAVRARVGADMPAVDIVRFLPEGGSIGAIIRSLGPAVDLSDGAGALPLSRHGSTLRALFAVSEALFSVAGTDGIVVADDFGEDLDPGSASHLAACIRARAAQAWLSTRRASAADAFEPDEIVRLARGSSGRSVFYGPTLGSKAERIAAQFITRRILPEAASSSIAVGEGIHDSTAMSALARRLFDDGIAFLPAAAGISITDAAANGGGGITAIPKVTAAARMLGFRTVAFIDWDRDAAEAKERLEAAKAAADCVVRLPQNANIEVALLQGLDDSTIIGALKALQPLLGAFNVLIPNRVWTETGDALQKSAADTIKSSVGFHAQFIEALPKGVYPPLAVRLLRALVDAAKGTLTGYVQL